MLYRYQDYQASDIPIVESGGVSVRVMAGESMNTTGPIKMRNPGMLLDCRLSKGATFEQHVSRHNTIPSLKTNLGGFSVRHNYHN